MDKSPLQKFLDEEEERLDFMEPPPFVRRMDTFMPLKMDKQNYCRIRLLTRQERLGQNQKLRIGHGVRRTLKATHSSVPTGLKE